MTRKILRELKRIAAEYGLKYLGQDGKEHYRFGTDDQIIARGPGTPKDPDAALIQFRAKCAAGEVQPMNASGPILIDGNEAFRKLDRERSR